MENTKKLIDHICELKVKRDMIDEEIERSKDTLMKDFLTMNIDECTSKFGKARRISFTRGTLDATKVENALIEAKHKHVTLDNCKKYSDCDYIVVKVDEDSYYLLGEEI